MIAVVIPCFKVRHHILQVISNIGAEVSVIVVVDDCCPEESGKYVEQHCKDPRVKVVFHLENQGVGGAVLTGYREALTHQPDVIVKVDGDGQMNPAMIPIFAKPILSGEADYTKGNRFFNLEGLSSMPLVRRIGNAGLSFISKLACGYWKIMDPTNGFTAISGKVAALLPFSKISRRYFFESDILFRLNTLGAVVEDIPMEALYANEISNLSCRKALLEFPIQYFIRFLKRIFYSYFLRDFSAASLELVLGVMLLSVGAIFGLVKWWHYSSIDVAAPTGTIFFAAMPVIFGFQLILAWLTYDISSTPTSALSRKLNFRNPSI